jgi:1,4-alpha-glucan branching enzyme
VLFRSPQGIWIPECGYEPALDEILKTFGIKYFLLDTHGILHGSPRPKYGAFAPIYCPSGVAAIGRDIESSKQVWSAKDGYPGDYEYRDFYRDIGFDLDYDYIRPYLHNDGLRVSTGIKYYRITGKTEHKAPYNPDRALEKAAIHAGNFMFNREKQVEYLFDFLGKKPVIVAPYDAELFGHWWYEGPQWLDFLIRKVAFNQKVLRMINLSEYLAIYPKHQVVAPSMSSWGWKGYSEVWLEGSNDWIYRHLHKAAEWMVELARNFPQAQGIELRALNQASREVLLAQSSDWAFIMKTGTMASYAVQRTKTHLLNFKQIREDLLKKQLNETWLMDLESRNNIFPDIDYRIYS